MGGTAASAGGNGRVVISYTTPLVVYDRSGQGNNGTLTSGFGRIIGKVGQALSFDGTNTSAYAGDVLNVVDSGKFSISGWFYRDTATTTDTIIAKKDASGTGAGYMVYLDASTDKLVLDVADGTDEYSVTSTTTFASVGWHHFVVVWDDVSATNTEIYIDGVADNGTDTGTLVNIGDLSNALTLRIGAESDMGNPFIGKLDEVRAYNRVLTQSEISDLYQSDGVTLNSSQNTANTNGLVGQWSFNGPDLSGTTAYDRSGQGNNGTLTNGPIPTQGKVGQALSFDGTDDYISLGNPAALQLTGDMTLSAWINPVLLDSNHNHNVIVSGRSIEQDQAYDLTVNSTSVGSVFRTDTGWQTQLVQAGTSIPTGSWTHVSIVRSGTNIAYYVNGVSIGSIAFTGTPIIGSGYLIGKGFYGGSHYFNGKVDEVRIYNRALSAGEVTALYNLGR